MASLRRFFGHWAQRLGWSARDKDAGEPEWDAAREFQGLQRSLRRLSLTADRNGQMLEAVAVRIDQVQQLLLESGRRAGVALALDETELLGLLDQLHRLAELVELPGPARSLVAGVTDTLLARARWRPVAHTGSRPDGADIRVAERLWDAAVDGDPDIRIHRVLEQGYRRADGTLLRPGIVVAGTAGADPHRTATRDGEE
jgi:hypothetical protein